MTLPDLSVRRPVATSMACVAVTVLGVVSFLRLPVNLLPDVAFPTLSVWTEYPGAGPAEVERFVTAPVEEALFRVPGVRRVQSRSREGQSLVRLRFAWGTDMEFATLHVRERLDNVEAGLPRAAGRSTILRTDPGSDPVMTVAVTGADLLQLRNLSESVFKRRMEQLDGVALASVTGGPVREIHVTVDPALLAAYGIGMETVAGALDEANFSAPGGQIRRGRYFYSLRTLGEFESLADLRRVVLRQSESTGGDGAGSRRNAGVRLSDVARVEQGFADRETLARHDGEPAVGLQVFKEAGTNTVRVVERAEEILEQLRAEFPEISLTVAQSQARFIREAIANVAQALLVGGVLAFLVLFLFLQDPRYPVAIGLSIPISVLAAFALLYLFDVSLNVMSLGGLALGVGMLVDNSIVVLENIFRHLEEGSSPDRAAVLGTREVTAAITASTLTTVAVFGPVLYVEGVAGALFESLSLAVTFALGASLLVALTLLPALAARLARGPATATPGTVETAARPPAGDADRGTAPHGAARGPNPDGSGGAASRIRRLTRRVARAGRAVRGVAARGLQYVVDSARLTAADARRALRRTVRGWVAPVLGRFRRFFEGFTARYERALDWSLRHRRSVVVAAVATLALAAGVGSRLPRGLMPAVDEGQLRVELELPVGTPLDATSRTAARLEQLLLQDPAVEGVFARVGRARGSELAGRGLSGVNSAALEVRLRSGAPPTRTVAADFRARAVTAGVPPGALSVSTGQATALGRALTTAESDLVVRVQGEDTDRLFALADSVRGRLAGLDLLADVRVDVARTQPELVVDVRRDAVARHGLTVRRVADAVEAYLRGLPTERAFTEFSEKVAIRVRLPADRRRLAEILDLTVGGVRVGELVDVREGFGPVEIRRHGQARSVAVVADVASGGLEEAVEAVRDRLADLEVSPPTVVRVGGANEEMRESFRSLLVAFGLALLLVYLILAAQFESLVQPAVILVAVPLAAVGAVLALGLTGGGINVMSGIGVVVLVGIVVNDAIIKVDFTNQLRTAGTPKGRAIREAGRLRLRPVVMTTVTTVLGLLPLALGWGAGADLRAPLAVAVIGGLLSSTALTLLVVPVVYDVVTADEVTVAGGPGGADAGTAPA